MEDTEKKSESKPESKSESSNGGSKRKTFSMVGGICSLVAAGMAVVYAIYWLVWAIQWFSNSSAGWGIFGLAICVLLIAVAAVGALGGIKLLLGSKLPLSTHNSFRNVFFFLAIVYGAIVLTEGIAWLVAGGEAGYWISYLIVGLSFLVGCVVLMLISLKKDGLLATILFFVGIACFMIGHTYAVSYYGNGDAGWAVWLLNVALFGVEAMGVLASIFEDKCFSKK
jgi:hypothetical protein